MVRSWSSRRRIGHDASTVVGNIFLDLGMQFCVAGAVFGEVGAVMPVVRDVSYVQTSTMRVILRGRRNI